MGRKILHVDMDAFFAAVEQRDNPEYAGKPLIIGGDPTKRGVVSTASYEARKYGVRSAMPLSQAHRLCPEGIFIPGNMAKYQRVSVELNRIFLDFTPSVEQISIDEAFLDVTGSQRLFGPATQIAMLIKERIREELHLTASVGLAGNKFLAKLASDMEKPDGFVLIEPENVDRILEPLPVSRIWGVGEKTAAQLAKLGITTIGELRSIPLNDMKQLFGKSGEVLYNLSRGIDSRPVEPYTEAKSMGREITFEEDIGDMESLHIALRYLCEDVGRRLRKNSSEALTITLKIRYEGFETHTRSKTLSVQTDSTIKIHEIAKGLLDKSILRGRKVRLLGIYLSNLMAAGTPKQISLMEEDNERLRELDKAMDSIRDRFGDGAIAPASLLGIWGNTRT
jgi:DNA polymerase-4